MISWQNFIQKKKRYAQYGTIPFLSGDRRIYILYVYLLQSVPTITTTSATTTTSNMLKISTELLANIIIIPGSYVVFFFSHFFLLSFFLRESQMECAKDFECILVNMKLQIIIIVLSAK